MLTSAFEILAWRIQRANVQFLKYSLMRITRAADTLKAAVFIYLVIYQVLWENFYPDFRFGLGDSKSNKDGIRLNKKSLDFFLCFCFVGKSAKEHIHKEPK